MAERVVVEIGQGATKPTSKWTRYLRGRKRRDAYRKLEQSGWGQEILKDLADFCCAGRDTYDPTSARNSDRNQGARAVWLHIEQQIVADEAKLQQQARENNDE